MYIVGIDPGLTGAIAVITPDKSISRVFDMPVQNKLQDKAIVKKQVYAKGLADLLSAIPTSMLIMEKVASRPQQGAASTFSLGDSFGVIRGVLSAFAIEPIFVLPQEWKRHYNLIGEEKSASLELAQKLFPNAPLKRKKDHNRAEALLIALYGIHLTRGNLCKS